MKTNEKDILEPITLNLSNIRVNTYRLSYSNAQRVFPTDFLWKRDAQDAITQSEKQEEVPIFSPKVARVGRRG
jgi:hypothetical protein